MAVKLSENSQFKQAGHVSWRKVGADAVVLDLNTSEYFSLNEVGALIWEKLCAGDDVQAITKAICDEYSVELAQAKKDTETLLQRMLAQKLIVAR